MGVVGRVTVRRDAQDPRLRSVLAVPADTTSLFIPRTKSELAPAVGFEPTTWRLTAARSTTELRRSEGPPSPLGRRSQGGRGRAAGKNSRGGGRYPLPK